MSADAPRPPTPALDPDEAESVTALARRELENVRHLLLAEARLEARERRRADLMKQRRWLDAEMAHWSAGSAS
ncbi:MAG TPA: hypothetical protein VF546_13935 [Pyrinomonadaceae bacterium]